ncbi:MAG: glycerol-3-phosphate 1-O-acyltransferase PlsY [Janthinobacterium lividum]
MIFCTFVLIAYFLGSIPFGLVLTQFTSGFDIRSTGSGNIGATNVLRSGHKILALLTLILDASKGACAILTYRYLANHHSVLFDHLLNSFQLESLTAVLTIATAVILGHIFPVFLKFKGGKGIATLGGCLFALSWPVGVCAMLLWLGTFLMSRKSALAGLIATFSLPLSTYHFSGLHFMFWSLGIALLIAYTHRANIMRLWQGKESTIDFTSSKTSS